MMSLQWIVIVIGCSQQLHASHVENIIKDFQASKGELVPQVPLMNKFMKDTAEKFLGRRLEAHEQPLVSQACAEKCPAAKQMQDDMDKMAKDMATKAAANPMPEQEEGAPIDLKKMSEQMDAMMPLMYEAMAGGFDIICANKAAVTCMSTNAEQCLPQEDEYGNAPDKTKDPAVQVECLCDKCPTARAAIANHQVMFMKVLMIGMASMDESATEKDKAAVGEQLAQDMLNGLCPFVGAAECLVGHPNCLALANPSPLSFGEPDKAQIKTEIAESKKQCEAAGVSTDPASVVPPGSDATPAGASTGDAAPKSYIVGALVAVVAAVRAA